MMSLVGQNTVTGKIIDQSTKQPLSGVHIWVKQTNTGVISDFDGNFQINIEQGQILTFSHIGFADHEVQIENQKTLNISLLKDTRKLDEVVVIGYGTAKKNDLTGAAKSISSTNFLQGNIGNIQGLVSGKVAGVRTNSSSGAEPGGEVNIRIRGVNSISGNNNPLYVVDGIPVPDNFRIGTDLNPNDIEKIDILKDASSTAIYGARAANGLVMISTKKAKTEKNITTFRATSGFKKLVKPISYASGNTLALIENEISAFNGNDPIFTNEEIEKIGDGTDWIEEATRIGVYQDYSLGFYSGNKNSKFNINLGHYKNEGVIKNTEFNRTTLATNYSTNLKDKLFLDGSIKLSYVDTNFLKFSEGNTRDNVMFRLLGASPLFPAYNTEGSYGIPPEGITSENPLPAILEPINDLKRNNIYSNISLKYAIKNNLEFKLNSGFLLSNSFSGSYNPRTTIDGALLGGIANVINQNNRNVLLEAFLNYTLDINQNVTKLLAGISQQNDYRSEYKSSAKGFNSDAYLYHNLAAANIIDPPSSNYVTTKRQSAFFRLNNSYAHKYLITATYRIDGSSRFGKNNKLGFFPSIGFGWKVSKEAFLKNSDLISNLKIRGSYGITGNDRIPVGRSNALSQTAWSTYAFDGGFGTVGFSPLNLPNPDLKWETTKQYNIGFELGLFKNRVNIEADYYDKITDDLLFEREVNNYLGLTKFLQNIGSVRNKGYELAIDATPIRSKQFKWNLNYNVAINKNEVLKLPDDAESLDLADFISFGGSNSSSYHKLQVGKPISAYYGFKLDRILQEGETSPVQPFLEPGEYTFKDIDEDGDIDDDDRVYLGSGIPVITMGLTNTFHYKKVSFATTLTGAFDYQLFNVNRARYENLYWKQAENRWTPINTDTDIPKSYAWSNTSIANDRFIEDASFVRIQNITLAYTLPKNKISLEDFTIAVSGENLHVFTNYSGFDPELTSSSNPTKAGLDWNTYPQNRVFSLIINAKF